MHDQPNVIIMISQGGWEGVGTSTDVGMGHIWPNLSA